MPKLKPETLAERKQHILNAALICFARKGYHQTTMDDIVEEAGLSKGGVYVHFDSKRALFQSLLTWSLSQFAFDSEHILAAGDSVHGRLKVLMRGMIEAMFSERFREMSPLFLEMWVQNLNDAAVKQTAVEMYDQFRIPLTELIESGVENGSLRPVDAQSLASTFIAVPEGLMVQALVDNDAIDWEAVCDTLDTLIDGLRLN